MPKKCSFRRFYRRFGLRTRLPCTSTTVLAASATQRQETTESVFLKTLSTKAHPSSRTTATGLATGLDVFEGEGELNSFAEKTN